VTSSWIVFISVVPTIHCIFATPEQAITHWHCKLGHSASVSMEVVPRFYTTLTLRKCMYVRVFTVLGTYIHTYLVGMYSQTCK
jgi:hypothetical protein